MALLRRWIFNSVVAVSLILFLAVAVLWVRSYFAGDSLTVQKNQRYSIRSYRGLLGVIASSKYSVSAFAPPPFTGGQEEPYSEKWELSRIATRELSWTIAFNWPNSFTRALLGFKIGYCWEPGDSDLGEMDVDSGYLAIAPHWAYMLALGCIPAFWLRRHRQQRFQKGHGAFCSVCGYDLRATPNQCPECGTVPNPAKNSE